MIKSLMHTHWAFLIVWNVVQGGVGGQSELESKMGKVESKLTKVESKMGKVGSKLTKVESKLRIIRKR
jgi:hypothetical protein